MVGMRRLIRFLPLAALVFSIVFAGTALADASGSSEVDYSASSDGICMARWFAGGDQRIKVVVKGPSGTSYQYNLNTGGAFEIFPLSDGNGMYNVTVYRNVSGTQYATDLSCNFSVNLSSPFAPFLRPNQYVNYHGGSAAVQTAAALCGGRDEMGMVEQVYNFVVHNVSYDQAKAASVQSGYLPNVDETLATGRGICFDYASLMSAMLRSQGVPVKLIVGYSGNAYHAWVNVWTNAQGWVNGAIFFNGSDWKLMDPTYASSANESAAVMQYIGNGGNYAPKYQY